MLKGLIFFIKFAWKEKKSYVILNAVNQLLSGILPLVIIAIPANVIDELMGAQRISVIAAYVILLILAIFVNSWVVQHINLVIFTQRVQLAARFDKYMHAKLAITDFCNLEKPSFHEMSEKAKKFLYGDGHGFSYVLESAFSIVGKVITLCGIIAIISMMNAWIVAIFLLMILASAFVDSKSKEKNHKIAMDAVNVERRWSYFSRILEDTSFSKEIRMNNISDWLLNKEIDYSEKAIGFYKKRNRFSSLSILFNAFTGLLQNGISYAYLVYRVIRQTITIGEFTLYLNAVATFSSAVSGVLSSLVDIKIYSLYYDALNEYVHIPETLRDNQKLPVPISEKGDFVISFHHVSFRYPGQEIYALKDINVEIHSGTKLSVVGENGAGKTTFVKLLCRLYDPTEGEILCNGVNIPNIDYDKYMAIFSAVFQDYKLFSFSIRDNIVLNDDANVSDERVHQLLQKVGLYQKISRLPKGIDTNIYKEFDESGIEPSGGEAQKIAIARAIARDSKIVILDEPLSALDPKAEHEIFEQFEDMVQGKTAIYISHRLSSSRACDSILVFQNGSIIEMGTHQELMQSGGKYAELYSLQADPYKD